MPKKPLKFHQESWNSKARWNSLLCLALAMWQCSCALPWWSCIIWDLRNASPASNAITPYVFFFKTEALKDISQELLCTRLVLGPLYEQDRHSSYLPRTRGPPWQMPNAFLLSSNVLAYMCCLWVDSTFRLCLRLCPYNVQWDHWFGSGLINANFGRLSSLLFLNQTYVGTKVT